MDIQESEDHGVCVVVPVGRIDSITAGDTEAALLPKFDSGKPVVVDLSALTYISSAGLRVLLIAAKRSTASGIGLALSGLSPQVSEVFKLSGFGCLFTIYDDKRDAVAALSM